MVSDLFRVRATHSQAARHETGRLSGLWSSVKKKFEGACRIFHFPTALPIPHHKKATRGDPGEPPRVCTLVQFKRDRR